jgi:hypothetical protein
MGLRTKVWKEAGMAKLVLVYNLHEEVIIPPSLKCSPVGLEILVPLEGTLSPLDTGRVPFKL